LLKHSGFLLFIIVILSGPPARGADQNPQSTEAVDQQSQPKQQSTYAQQTNPSQTAASAKHSIKPIKLEAEEDYWIDPDRPHIADSSVNVPKGLWLQENGFQQSYARRNSGAFDFPESLIRLGVAKRLELRYNTPNFIATNSQNLNALLVSQTERTTTFQNMQAGFKSRIGPLGPTKFELAVNPYISIPTAFSGQSSRVDGNIKFPFSQRLNDKWDIEGMESFFDPTVNGHPNADWQNSPVLNRSWGRQKNVFIEYVGDLYEHGPMSNLIHFGGAYRPNRRQQFDTQFGFRMNNAAPVAFFGFGYSFLLGNLNTPELTPSRFTKP
jgi:hypothetical protein